MVDGHEFRYGFDKKTWADDFVDRLNQHFVLGYPFDPVARRFLEPTASSPGPTYVDHAADHFRRNWPDWSPKRRQEVQRELALASLHLIRDDASALTVDERLDADRYLRTAVLVMQPPETLSRSQRAWQAWFARWSLPLVEISDTHLHAFLSTVRTQALDGTPRTLAPNTLRRIRAIVGATFVGARKRRLIDWNPWDAVDWKMPPDHDQIDPDLVMDLAEMFALAAAVAEIDRRYECFVLIQGICGLRPGEARDLRRRDLDLVAKPAIVRPRGSHSDVPARFFDEGESRRRPLKGRGRKVSRPIPIPASLVPLLQAHLDEFVKPGSDALVCTTPSGTRINLSNFHRDVWDTARSKVFEAGSPLRKVRRHDLRHSAITTWLNTGVLLKTAQRWSGHKTASVLLDTYLGVMRDDASISLARVEGALDDALAERGNRDGPMTEPEEIDSTKEVNSGN